MKKFLLGVLVGVVLVVLILIIGFFALLRLGQAPPVVPEGATLLLRISGEVPERAQMEMPFAFLEEQTPLTLQEYWELLRKAAADPRVKAVVLLPEGVQAGWSKLQELRDCLVKFKSSGKPLVALLRSAGSREYYLATAADRIALAPDDWLNLKGLRAEALYVRDTLDKLGVKMEIEHTGKYKDAGDMFTRNSMSPETREVLNSVLDGIYAQLVGAIAESRKKTPDEVRALIDQGPFLARVAQSQGLVDALQYEDQVMSDLRLRLGQNRIRRLSHREYARVTPESVGLSGKRKIAFLVGEGAITRGGLAGTGEEGITSGGFIREVRRVADDPSIRGVVLRVDSPGGDGVASDEILRELRLLSQKKPLVISMSDVAASGGYFIAMTGDTVLAYPNTLTGSIGVVYGKLNLRGLYDKIGVRKETLKRGRWADIDSDYTPLTPEARARLRESIREFYGAFIGRVAEGRKRKPDEIEPLAQGRVWLGAQALERGLIDGLGGLDRAIELVKQRAGIPPDERIHLVVYPPKRSFFDLLFSRSGDAQTEARLRSVLKTRGLDPSWLTQEGILKQMPYQVRVY